MFDRQVWWASGQWDSAVSNPHFFVLGPYSGDGWLRKLSYYAWLNLGGGFYQLGLRVSHAEQAGAAAWESATAIPSRDGGNTPHAGASIVMRISTSRGQDVNIPLAVRLLGGSTFVHVRLQHSVALVNAAFLLGVEAELVRARIKTDVVDETRTISEGDGVSAGPVGPGQQDSTEPGLSSGLAGAERI